MSRRTLVRTQLMILAVLVLALAGRRLWTSVGQGADVVIEGVEPFELHQVAFALDAPTRVLIQATASLEQNVEGAPLATNVWIVPRGEHRPAWQLVRGEHVRRRGTLLTASEEVTLGPATYDAYFASFGNDMYARRRGGFFGRLFGRELDWEKDSGRWHLRVRAIDDKANIRRVGEASGARDDPGVIWRTAPMKNGSGERSVFEVASPLDIRVYAIGELSESGRDYGWIDDLSARRRVWELSLGNTEHAGGHTSNRVFDGALRLVPGVYAASFETDADHGPDHWRANPPFDPRGWGITITTSAENARAVSPFDPWESRTPLLDLTRIGSSQHESVTFTVKTPISVVIDALGEVSSTEQYDYGWIENESGERIWEMRYANSSSAGGHRYNRAAMEIVHFPVGGYTAHFVTDDTHAYGDWYKTTPQHPERWGMAVFPLGSSVPAGALSIVQRVTSVPSPDDPEPGSLLRLPDLPGMPEIPRLEELSRHIAVQINSVGNSANLQESLRLDNPRKVIVIAQGEILPTDRYDYAWIERADNGETIWSMTWDNTHPAGGDDRNRIFTGVVDLPAGDYVVRFRSDPSHAYGDFGKIAPAEPESWGVSVVVPPAPVHHEHPD